MYNVALPKWKQRQRLASQLEFDLRRRTGRIVEVAPAPPFARKSASQPLLLLTLVSEHHIRETVPYQRSTPMSEAATP